MNISTAVDTRSLSIRLFPVANNSSSLLTLDKNSSTNVALLFYENANGKVSALLQCLTTIISEGGSEDTGYQWIDITSQESKALPNEFRNSPGLNYRNTLGEPPGNSITFSHTLYEADPTVEFSTPFFSVPNSFGSSGGALFYSPNSSLLNTTSPRAGGSFLPIDYTFGVTGPGNFTLSGMHYIASYSDCVP